MALEEVRTRHILHSDIRGLRRVSNLFSVLCPPFVMPLRVARYSRKVLFHSFADHLLPHSFPEYKALEQDDAHNITA